MLPSKAVLLLLLGSLVAGQEGWEAQDAGLVGLGGGMVQPQARAQRNGLGLGTGGGMGGGRVAEGSQLVTVPAQEEQGGIPPATESEVDLMVEELMKEQRELEERERALDAREALVGGGVVTPPVAAAQDKIAELERRMQEQEAGVRSEEYKAYADAAKEGGSPVVPPAGGSGVSINMNVGHHREGGGVNVNLNVDDSVREPAKAEEGGGAGEEEEEVEEDGEKDGYSKDDMKSAQTLLHSIERSSGAAWRAPAAAATRPASHAKHAAHKAAMSGASPGSSSKGKGEEEVRGPFGMVLDDEKLASSPHSEVIKFKGLGMKLAAKVKWEPGAAAWYAYQDAQGKYGPPEGLEEGGAGRLGASGAVAWAVAALVAVAVHVR